VTSNNPKKGEEQMKDNKRQMKLLAAVSMACIFFGMASMAQAADFAVGGGVGIAPDYEGSDDYEAVPIPFGAAIFSNGMYVKLEGLTVRSNLIPSSWVEWLRAGPMYNYRASRSDVDNSKVDDLQNVSDAHELGALVGFEYNKWFAFLEYLADTGDAHDGWLTTLKGGYNWIISDAWALSIGGHGTYASGDYMSTYFGIDGADSARSGLSTYDADAGMKDIGIDLGVNWGFYDGWNLRGIASISQLVGDADDDSPVTDEGSETQFFGGVLVVYEF
jgi:outer membrane protein